MKNFLILLVKIFISFRILIILFPIFSFLYYIKNKSLKRLILLIGTIILLIGKILTWYYPLRLLEYNDSGNMIIHKTTILTNIDYILVAIGFLVVFVAFYYIVKDEYKSDSNKIFKYFKKTNLWKISFSLGVIFSLIGFFIQYFYHFLGVKHEPLYLFKNLLNILITYDQLFIISGIFFILIGFFGIILTNKNKY